MERMLDFRVVRIPDEGTQPRGGEQAQEARVELRPVREAEGHVAQPAGRVQPQLRGHGPHGVQARGRTALRGARGEDETVDDQVPRLEP